MATSTGKNYRALDYHRTGGNPHKTVWIIPRPEEFALFCTADDEQWRDHRGYWSFRNGTRESNCNNRARIAHFPTPSNAADDWHGYPIALNPVRRPESQLANQWVAQELISFAIGEKIKRGRL